VLKINVVGWRSIDRFKDHSRTHMLPSGKATFAHCVDYQAITLIHHPFDSD
jgi:hypothetical protein